MKTVLSIFRIRFINSMQYRAVLLGDILTRFVWGLMEILAFSALYRTGHAVFSMDFSQTVSYIWMQQALYTMFIVVFGDDEIYSSIGSGSIAYELVRPVNLYDRWFSQSAANRIASTVLGCLPVLLVAMVMPAPYRMSLPLDGMQFLLFVVSSLLALCVVVAFAMLMYISLFYTLSQRGIKIIATAVTTFLSGGIIPLPFFPEPVLAVVRWLPFAAMQNMPLRIYAGDIAGMDAVQGIALQLGWLAALVFLGRQAMRGSLKKVVVQEGDMKLYLDMIAMNLKSQMQYKLSFFLSTFGQFITAFTSFFGLYFIFSRVDAIDDFTYGQVLLCFSVVMMDFSIGELIGGGLASFPTMLGNGKFDRALVSPRSVLMQVLMPNMDFTRLGLLVQALLVLCYAIPASGVAWTWDKIVTLLLMILCGSALFYGLFLLKATFSFFTVESLNFLNIFTYGARQFGRYPFSAYGKGVLKFLTFVIPLALFQYYPLLYLLDREHGAVFTLLPVATLLFLVPTYAFFRFGLSRYKSTGS